MAELSKLYDIKQLLKTQIEAFDMAAALSISGLEFVCLLQPAPTVGSGLPYCELYLGGGDHDLYAGTGGISDWDGYLTLRTCGGKEETVLAAAEALHDLWFPSVSGGTARRAALSALGVVIPPQPQAMDPPVIVRAGKQALVCDQDFRLKVRLRP